MKAYWVVRGHILDIEEYSKYIELAGPIIKKYQGIFLARGGRQVELEGSGYDRTVLIEFKSYEQALLCYQSDDYKQALIHVSKSANRLVAIVEGIE